MDNTNTNAAFEMDDDEINDMFKDEEVDEEEAVDPSEWEEEEDASAEESADQPDMQKAREDAEKLERRRQRIDRLARIPAMMVDHADMGDALADRLAVDFEDRVCGLTSDEPDF